MLNIGNIWHFLNWHNLLLLVRKAHVHLLHLLHLIRVNIDIRALILINRLCLVVIVNWVFGKDFLTSHVQALKQ